MNRNEKILAALAGGTFLAIMGYLLVAKVVLTPAAEQAAHAAQLRLDVQRMENENAQKGYLTKRFLGYAGRTFESDENLASAAVRDHVTALVQRSGLGASELSLTELKGAPVPGIYREVGWTVRVRGPLDRAVHLLYLANRDPYLHRLESLNLSPVARSAEVELQARYSTLVLLPPPKQKNADPITLRTNQVADALDQVKLDGPERRRYDGIVQRDLFRPYVKRPVEPTRVMHKDPPVTYHSPTVPPPTAPPWARLQVVGLPAWGGEQDIFLKDGATGQVRKYAPGDELAGGTIVMVDYRLLAMPDRPEILSGSRILLRIGPDLWAVELGQTLAQKRILPRDRLPPALQSRDPAETEADAPSPADQTAAPAGEQTLDPPHATTPSDGPSEPTKKPPVPL